MPGKGEYVFMNYYFRSHLTPSKVAAWAAFTIALLTAEIVPTLTLAIRRIECMFVERAKAAAATAAPGATATAPEVIVAPLVIGTICIIAQIALCAFVGKKIHNLYDWRDNRVRTGLKACIWIAAALLIVPWNSWLITLAKITSSMDALHSVYWFEGARFILAIVFGIVLMMDWNKYKAWRRQKDNKGCTFWQYVCCIYPVQEEQRPATDE